MDSLGDRIKRYEATSNDNLLPRSPLFIRIDGKTFHSYTKRLNAQKPFDGELNRAMVHAARLTAKEMQGFKMAYIQSDEVTFMLTDYDTHETQGWFGYELNKVVSVSASVFTAHFNRLIEQHSNYHYNKPLAYFDSRAFTVPRDDAPNVFLWRQRDWERNSVQMYARAFFSQKQIDGKKNNEILNMLRKEGHPWAQLPMVWRYGTFIWDNKLVYGRADYGDLNKEMEAMGC